MPSRHTTDWPIEFRLQQLVHAHCEQLSVHLEQLNVHREQLNVRMPVHNDQFDW